MAFSNLTSLTEDQYKALTFSFNKPPVSSSSGSPDSRVSIQLGGWVSENILAFQIITAAAASSTLTIDPTLSNTLDINILASSSTNPTTTYWTLDVGTDNRSSDWSVNFQVAANNRNTGTWVFVKGKVGDDQDRF